MPCIGQALRGAMLSQTRRPQRVRQAAVVASACLLGVRLAPLALTFAFAGSWPKPQRQWTRRYAESATAPYRVLVPIAEDSEEIETACITDVLTRAGADVTVASVSGALQVRMSRGLKVVADTSIEECADQPWDVIALPGGMPGAEHLRDSQVLVDLLKAQKESGRVTAAVCASPAVVFAHHGIVKDAATCYPAPQFKELVGAGWKDAKAVVDGNVITSQGPGTSLQFALKIVEQLYGKDKAEELAAQMVTVTACSADVHGITKYQLKEFSKSSSCFTTLTAVHYYLRLVCVNTMSAYGLRLINNNATPGGNGRDFIVFGDETFRRGKAESPAVRGSPAMEVLRARRKARAAERALAESGSLPGLAATQRNGSARLGPGLAVIQKWNRIHTMGVRSDADRLRYVEPPMATDGPAAQRPTYPAKGSDPMMSWEAALFQRPTFPVPQYHHFSMAGVTHAKIPAPQPGEVAPEEFQAAASDK
ncbi:DJ1B, partial [Symbiodinium sp. KB8]